MTTATTAIGGDGLVVFTVATASRSIRMTIVTVYAMVGSRSRDINKNEGISRGGLFPHSFQFFPILATLEMFIPLFVLHIDDELVPVIHRFLQS